jgi:coenzyme F420-reducing hydrogenase alpha subunit
MSHKVSIDIHHITRVEGHGNIVVDVVNGEIRQCELQVTETPRFFEAMLRGRPYQDYIVASSGKCVRDRALTANKTLAQT